MKTRIKYIKTPKNGWLYAIQVKKWLFWKTIETYATIEGAERFLNILKEVDEFNSETKSLNKIVYNGWGVRNVYEHSGISRSINFFESYPIKIKNNVKSEMIWKGSDGNSISTMEIDAKELFGKECLEPMKLRITIEQIEEE
jgi:hypothetical protein